MADGMNAAIYRLSPDGELIEVVAREGNGPGEVQGPTMLDAATNGRVVTYDLVHNAVEVFAAGGAFIERIRLQSPIVYNPKGLAILPDGKFVLSGGIPGNCCAIHWFSKTGELIRSANFVPETQIPRAGVLVAGGPIEALPNGSILFSSAAPHSIEVYDSNGQMRLIAADPNLITPIGDDFIQVEQVDGQISGSYKWNFPQSRGVFRLTGGRYLNIVWVYNQNESVWGIYSPTGTLIVRDTISRAYEPWNIAQNGDVLATYQHPITGEHILVRLELTIVPRAR